MDIDIKELHRITIDEYDRMSDTILDAFSTYPMLAGAFPDWNERQIAIEMLWRYYMPYNFKYGYAYSLDDNIDEVLMIMDGNVMDYEEEKIIEAGCDNEEYRAVAARFSEENKALLEKFFDELVKLESKLDVPNPHMYIDAVAVRQEHQNRGKGSRLIEAAKRKSRETGVPIMLFTNGERDIKFYIRHGFRIIDVTESEEYNIRNIYMLYEPQ